MERRDTRDVNQFWLTPEDLVGRPVPKRVELEAISSRLEPMFEGEHALVEPLGVGLDLEQLSPLEVSAPIEFKPEELREPGSVWNRKPKSRMRELRTSGSVRSRGWQQLRFT